MQYTLTAEEKFADRIELVGYITAIAAAIFLIVYFGMIFFYQPVQTQALVTKAGLLLLPLAIFPLGLLLPQRRNFARLLLLLFYFALAAYSHFHTWHQGQWLFGLVWAFALFSVWTLSHPAAIQFFRRLRAFETRTMGIANWFSFHVLFLSLFGLVKILDGAGQLLASTENFRYDPDRALVALFLGFLLMILAQFLRRLLPWARWAMAFLCLGISLATLPSTMDTQLKSYVDYWQSLAQMIYFFAMPIYLIFSAAVKTAFRRAPVEPKPLPNAPAQP